MILRDHGAFRFHQYLKRVKSTDGESASRDSPGIGVQKEPVWSTRRKDCPALSRRLFLPECSISDLDRAAREAKAEETFLAR